MKTNQLVNYYAATMPMGDKIFRVNVVGKGRLWTGNKFKKVGNSLIIESPRPVVTPNAGTADYIGWSEQIVTADMVGEKIAVFLAVEFKIKGDVQSDDQIKFQNSVEKAGGIYKLITDKNIFTLDNK